MGFKERKKSEPVCAVLTHPGKCEKEIEKTDRDEAGDNLWRRLVARSVESAANLLEAHSQGLSGNWIKLFRLAGEVNGDLSMGQAFSGCQLCAG